MTSRGPSAPAIPPPRHKPELMSPAGHWPQLSAAVEAGADAVYFGLKHFTARAKVGFTLVELTEVMRTLHGRGVKGYVTFNTLAFEHEVDEAARAIGRIAEAGADAIIVQDVGLARLAREIVPDLPVHGSTQMSLTSAEGIRVAQSLGVTRVILARELSLEDLRAIRAATDCELEIFVHGALCVSYSGQCFSSEAWGGRSANRGQCAQACRLPYELIVDDAVRPLGDARYLLSPGDLNTLRAVPGIVALGLDALKIEGRYKDEQYVALVTKAYRAAVDAAWEGRDATPSPEEEIRVEQVYSRGSGPFFLSGTNHQAVVPGRAGRHRGVRLGRVVAVTGDSVIVEPSEAHRVAPLAPGDGVVFDAADRRSPEEREEGGRLYEVRATDIGLELRFGNGEVDFARIRSGDLLWRTDRPDTERAARPYTKAAGPVRRQPVRVAVTAHEGAPIEVVLTLAGGDGASVTVHGTAPLPTAANRPLDAAQCREQLGRLGGTAYELAEVTVDVRGRPFAPVSALNELRRQAVAALAALQQAVPVRPVGDARAARERLGVPAARRPAADGAASELHLLVRTPEQLDAALALRPAGVTLDYLDLYGLRPSVERTQAAGVAVRVASPRVLKPNEERIVTFLRKLDADLLVRSTGLLHSLRESGFPFARVTGDFSLNVANELTAAVFLEMGLARVTPTHDLNGAQVAALTRALGGDAVEVVAYHHLPVFHTEHCVFCRFLSTGTSYKDCGRPCESHRVALRDAQGRAHPVLADVGCRNTVFGAEAQEASRHLDEWRAAGVRQFRLEFAHESAGEVTRIAKAWAEALAGRVAARDLARILAANAPGGTTEGSLFVPADYERIPLLG